jgi:small-conductance mechanosensitive channel
MSYIFFFLKMLALVVLIFLLEDPFQWKEEWPLMDFLMPVSLMRFLVFAGGAHLLIQFLSWWYRKSKTIEEGRADNVLIGLKNIFYILLFGAALVTALSLFGVDLRTLFTSLSIVAAAIAIISKDYISEIISGIIISFSSEIMINDYVKIGTVKGKIIDINLTKIALLNDDDDVIFLPNNRVFSSDIINYTRREIRKVSVEFELDLKAIHTVEELEAELSAVLADYHQHIEPNSFNLKIVEIRKDSLSLKFQYTLTAIDRELERDIRRATVRRVVNYVKENYSPATPDGTLQKL